jgi:hypothetical protein
MLSILTEANVEKLGTDPILIAELVVFPRACILHGLVDGNRLLLGMCPKCRTEGTDCQNQSYTEPRNGNLPLLTRTDSRITPTVFRDLDVSSLQALSNRQHSLP